jgi:tetratricopeptide (TPR) repeat protein
MLTKTLWAIVFAVTLTIPDAAGSQPINSEEFRKALVSGKWADIDAAAGKWLQQPDSKNEASVIRGYAALAQGHASEAIRHFLHARLGKENPASAKWIVSLTSTYPDSSVTQLLAGHMLASKGETSAAIAQLDTALKLNPGLHVARLARAMLRMLEGGTEAALEDLNQLEKTAVAADALVVTAIIQIGQKNFSGAEESLARAMKLEPDHAIAFNTLGILKAQQNKWREAAVAFESAFQRAPELVQAKINYQLAKAAQESGTVVSTNYHLGVFIPGINSETDISYAKTHSNYLFPNDRKTFLYVGFIGDRGTYPTANVNRMTAQGIPSVVVDTRNVAQADRQIGTFIKDTLAQGKSPMIIFDVNKIVPTQLGNGKASAMEIPAHLFANSSVTFQREIGRIGVGGNSQAAAHSDGTYPALIGSILAVQRGAPFQRVIAESTRSEGLVKGAVNLAPNTQYNVIQPIRGDLFTLEGQTRFLGGDVRAYEKTIGNLKSISAPNYTLTLIDNPSARTPSFGNIVGAHGDPANLNRMSQVSIWRGNQQIGGGLAPLGTFFGPAGLTDLTRNPVQFSPGRGGVDVGPIYMKTGEGGRVLFKTGREGKLELVYTLFGPRKPTESAAGIALRAQH